MKKKYVLLIPIVSCIILGLFSSFGRGEVASCRSDDHGLTMSCMEFASNKPIPVSLEKTCTAMGKSWAKNPCPRSGTIGYCEIPRKDTTIQVVYCYKRAGIPDKQKLEFCKQDCKGRFAGY